MSSVRFRVGEAAGALVRDTTPGQRWTAGLALGLAVLLVTFGMPEDAIIGGTGRAGASSPRRVGPAASGSSVAPAGDIALPDAGPSPAAAFGGGGVPNAAPAPSGEPVAGPPSPAVAPVPIVLVARADDGPPGRTDADVAKAFLAASRLDARLVTVNVDDEKACPTIGGAGSLVVTSRGVGPAVRGCLEGAGATVLGFDARGPSAALVSTARGTRASLGDIGRWAAKTGSLPGAVGVVADSSIKDAVEPGLEELRRAGVRVDASTYLDDGPSGDVAVSDGVRAFAAKGIRTVLFAASPDHQRRWIVQASLLAPNTRYVVSDAAGAIVDEAYPPLFDGALAHTALRVPWFARAHGESPEQAECRKRWEATGPLPVTDALDAVRVLAWCQHLALVLAALPAIRAGTPPAKALTAAAVSSPLTSDLGPLPDQTWGPVADAVLVWRASCACWSEQTPFAQRSP